MIVIVVVVLCLQVVLASTADLECGFSRELFLQMCDNPKNTIIMTSKTSPGTLARQLIDAPEQKHVTLEVRTLYVIAASIKLQLQ